MALTWPDKDPDEVLDYKVDWETRLNGDTISTSTWVVPSGITKDSDSIGSPATETVIWLSGGTDDTRYELVNRITTAGGRTMEETVVLYVRDSG